MRRWRKEFSKRIFVQASLWAGIFAQAVGVCRAATNFARAASTGGAAMTGIATSNSPSPDASLGDGLARSASQPTTLAMNDELNILRQIFRNFGDDVAFEQMHELGSM